MDGPDIIGICLLRNEDLFVGRVLTNILDFCDRILVADHKSTDKTAGIVQEICKVATNIEYNRINMPGESHEMISHLAGTSTWIFAVDGDEIYDPSGLRMLRSQIKAGDYDQYFRIMGNVLNCIEFDEKKRIARGHLAPPCRSITKLYNFGALDAWEGPTSERLHGGKVIYKNGYNYDKSLNLHKITSWENSIFRCLHTVFLKRSSKDDEMVIGARLNPSEAVNYGPLARVRKTIRSIFGRHDTSNYKNEKYKRGVIVEKDIMQFFTDSSQQNN